MYISNVTFAPSTTVGQIDVSVTGAGGSPNAQGYTIILDTQTLTGQTVTFTVPSPGPDASVLPNLGIEDANSAVLYQIVFTEISTGEQIIFNIDSLPLGAGPGCFTLSVTNPPVGNQVTFSAFATPEPTKIASSTQVTAPFSQTFSSFASTSQQILFLSNERKVISAIIGIGSDQFFGLIFSFPQGQGNALKNYIFNNYCSCVLLKDTLAVPTI